MNARAENVVNLSEKGSTKAKDFQEEEVREWLRENLKEV